MAKIWRKEDLIEAMRLMALARLRLVSAAMGHKQHGTPFESEYRDYTAAARHYFTLERLMLEADVGITYSTRERREIENAQSFLEEHR